MKHNTRFLFLPFFCLLLLSCSNTANTGTTATATNTQSVSSTPTTVKSPTSLPQPTPTFKHVYRGTDFSIGYPDDWTATPHIDSQEEDVEFAESVDQARVYITSSHEESTPETLIQYALSTVSGFGSDYQVLPVPATTTINGVIWNQKKVSAVSPTGDPVTLLVLATKQLHNPNRAIMIQCGAKNAFFADSEAKVFHPMLQSFTFQ
ncbi:hypothetical protein [Ktedonospora formicarum]|uniref:hypothetical protein n=1 Tax=Ktedonospora formicarum TaxID=2778364 RepID=UPI001C68822A|nr:hypothetical protein [Ktedonospora formicarum]